MMRDYIWLQETIFSEGIFNRDNNFNKTASSN